MDVGVIALSSESRSQRLRVLVGALVVIGACSAFLIGSYDLSDVVVGLASLAFLVGALVVGWAGGLRAALLLAGLAPVLVSLTNVASGADDRRLPQCEGIMIASGDPCGSSLADQAFSGLVPASLIVLLGGAGALARRAKSRGLRALG